MHCSDSTRRNPDDNDDSRETAATTMLPSGVGRDGAGRGAAPRTGHRHLPHPLPATQRGRRCRRPCRTRLKPIARRTGQRVGRDTDLAADRADRESMVGRTAK
jgi:hypothetical protein